MKDFLEVLNETSQKVSEGYSPFSLTQSKIALQNLLEDVLLRKLREQARDDTLTMEWGDKYDRLILSKQRWEAELERQQLKKRKTKS